MSENKRVRIHLNKIRNKGSKGKRRLRNTDLDRKEVMMKLIIILH